MVDLTNVTLVSPIYNESQEYLSLTIRMIRYMRSVATFYHVILVTACKPEERVPAEVLQIPPTDIRGLQTFQISVLPKFISTPFMMVAHYDGFIIEPELWSSEFLKYDFIGAPWAEGIVGNDGFSLQSQKLLWEKARLPWTDTAQGDEYICRTHRQRMENCGVTFAPCDTAARFASETTDPSVPSFGFHGKTHSDLKYKKGWELIEAFEKRNHGE